MTEYRLRRADSDTRYASVERVYLSSAVNHATTATWLPAFFGSVGNVVLTVDYGFRNNTMLAGSGDLGCQFVTEVDGIYRIRCHAEFDGNATGNRRELQIVSGETYNNVTGVAAGTGTVLSNSVTQNKSSVACTVFVTHTVPLAANTKVSVEALQNSGGALAYTVGSIYNWCDIRLMGEFERG